MQFQFLKTTLTSSTSSALLKFCLPGDLCIVAAIKKTDKSNKQNRYHHLYCTTTIKYKSVMYATYVKPTRSGRTREQDYFRKTHAKPFFGAEQLRYLYSAQNYVRCQYGSSCSLSIFYSNVPKTQQRQRTH